MSTALAKTKEEIYRKPLETVLGKDAFTLEVEDYEQSKFLVVTKKTDGKKVEPCLFISINKNTGIAKGFSSNPSYEKHAPEIKNKVEEAYRKEKKLFEY